MVLHWVWIREVTLATLTRKHNFWRFVCLVLWIAIHRNHESHRKGGGCLCKFTKLRLIPYFPFGRKVYPHRHGKPSKLSHYQKGLHDFLGGLQHPFLYDFLGDTDKPGGRFI